MSSAKVAPTRTIVKSLPGLGEVSAGIYIDSPHNDRNRTKPLPIGEWFRRELHIARDGGRLIYLHHKGCFRHGAREIVEAMLPDFLCTIENGDKWTDRLAHSVIEYLRATSPLLWEKPPRGQLNVLNGILNTETLELSEHTPKFLSTFQIPVIYNPNAKGTAWADQIKAAFEDDCIPLAYQMFAWSLMPHVKADNLIMLYGPEGSNGKSMHLDGWEHFIGKENVIRQELQSLVGSKSEYYIAALHGKLLCIGSDIPSKKLMNTGELKALISNERMIGRHPAGRPFNFDPFVRLVFAMNKIPQSLDITNAYFRRLRIVPFYKTFRPDPGRKAEIMAKLVDPQELSSLLNSVLPFMHGLTGVEEFGLDEPVSCKDEKTRLMEQSDPIYGFIAERVRSVGMTIDDVEGTWVTNVDLLRAWNDWSLEHGIGNITDRSFFMRFSVAMGERIDTDVIKIEGKATRIKRGIRLLTSGEATNEY